MGDLRGRLIAFDLDGTLVDSRRDLADSANELILERGGRPLAEEVVGRLVGEGAASLVSRALRASGLGDVTEPAGSSDLAVASGVSDSTVASGSSRQALERFLEIYDTRLLRHTVPYPGIVEAIEAARRDAHVAVLTNKPLRATERILTGLGLRRFFESVIGGDGPWPRKPDPASLRHLMAIHHAEPEATVLVGDSRIDFETARAAGTRICLARYGYGYESLFADALRGNEALIDAPQHLPLALTRLLGSAKRNTC